MEWESLSHLKPCGVQYTEFTLLWLITLFYRTGEKRKVYPWSGSKRHSRDFTKVIIHPFPQQWWCLYIAAGRVDDVTSAFPYGASFLPPSQRWAAHWQLLPWVGHRPINSLRATNKGTAARKTKLLCGFFCLFSVSAAFWCFEGSTSSAECRVWHCCPASNSKGPLGQCSP